MGDAQDDSSEASASSGTARPQVALLDYHAPLAGEGVAPVQIAAKGVMTLACAVFAGDILRSFATANWMIGEGAPWAWTSASWAEVWGFPSMVVLMAAVPTLMYWYRGAGHRFAAWVALTCTVGLVLVLLGGDQYAMIRKLMDRARLGATSYAKLLDALRNMLSPALCLLLVVTCRVVSREQRTKRRGIVWSVALLVAVYAAPWLYSHAGASWHGSAMWRVREAPWAVCLTGIVLIVLMVMAPSSGRSAAARPIDWEGRRFVQLLPIVIAGVVWLAALQALLPLGIANATWPYELEARVIAALLSTPNQVPFRDMLHFITGRLAPMAVALISGMLVLAWLLRPQRPGVWLSWCLMVQFVLVLLPGFDSALPRGRWLTDPGWFASLCGGWGQALILAVPTLVALVLLQAARRHGDGLGANGYGGGGQAG